MNDMTDEKFEQLIRKQHGSGTGLYFADMSQFVNGDVKLMKSGNVKLTIELPAGQLGSPMNDVRSVLAPHCYQNDLVPMVVFVDPKQLEAAQSKTTVDEQVITSLVEQVRDNFNSFGGVPSSWNNPIAAALIDKPAVFAAGVSIEDVVRFITEKVKA